MVMTMSNFWSGLGAVLSVDVVFTVWGGRLRWTGEVGFGFWGLTGYLLGMIVEEGTNPVVEAE